MLAIAQLLALSSVDDAVPLPSSKLHMLAAGEGGNACLDGSPYGYYVAVNQSSDNWVIDIEGACSVRACSMCAVDLLVRLLRVMQCTCGVARASISPV